jgi:membrane-associated phospholipid phosphatase
MARRRKRSEKSPVLRTLVRAGAAACIAGALAAPLLRRRGQVPATATVAILTSGPLALAVLWPRSKKRDVVLFALQMWGFLMAHEIPYDDPERLRSRLRTRYPIAIDRALGGGTLPSIRLQRAFAKLGRGNALDRSLTWVHWVWFFEPYLVLLLILIRHNDRFPRAARQMAATYDIGCAVYFAAPTAPPWWSSEQGETDGEVRRIMVEVGEETWGRAWPAMYDTLGGNPWAAMPSLHFATSLMAAIHLSEAGRAEGAAGFAYAGALGFALVYLGEHYVTDLLAGAALVAAVRMGEPLAEPVVTAINRRLQGLEELAAG